MMRVAQSDDKDAHHIRFAALYNIGRAYFQGYGVRQSNEQAEKFVIYFALQTQIYLNQSFNLFILHVCTLLCACVCW
jgi:hypothetical protein